MSKMALAILKLDISLMAVKHTVRNGSGEISDRLNWAGSELDRIASECYSLADNALELTLCDNCGSNEGVLPVSYDTMPGMEETTELCLECRSSRLTV